MDAVDNAVLVAIFWPSFIEKYDITYWILLKYDDLPLLIYFYMARALWFIVIDSLRRILLVFYLITLPLLVCLQTCNPHVHCTQTWNYKRLVRIRITQTNGWNFSPSNESILCCAKPDIKPNSSYPWTAINMPRTIKPRTQKLVKVMQRGILPKSDLALS